jgi:hypothetical protein
VGFRELKINVPLSNDHVPLAQVMRYFTRTLRFEALCRFDAGGGMALPTAVREYAMTKYKRHRTVPESLLIDVAAELEARVAKLMEDERASGQREVHDYASCAREGDPCGPPTGAQQ